MSNKDGAQPPSDNNTTEQGKQTQAASLTAVPHNYAYNTPELESFLATVFHSAPDHSEYAVFAPAGGNMPGYPINSQEAFDAILRSGRPRAMYYSTSSLYRQADGKLRNRNDNVAALHVIVLDDIGTKIDKDSLPEGMQNPTYIVESSEGNFQYGYVLESPIRDIDDAQALIELVKNHEPAITDKGGVLLAKAVRLPAGINGKEGPKGQFNVRLVLDDGPFYPAEVLQRELEDGQVEATQAVRVAGRGDRLFDMPDYGRPEDEVKMWLYANSQVLADDPSISDWVTIECPWQADHSGSDVNAGYSPLGYGSNGHEDRRGFKCFHDHCSDKRIEDFLATVLASEPSFRALAPHLPSGTVVPPKNYALSTNKQGGAYHLAGRQIIEAQLGGMKQKYYSDIWAVTSPKPKFMNVVDYWAVNPLTMRVDGVGYEVTEARLLEDGEQQTLNNFTPPEWQDGPFDAEPVDKFLSFVAYLLPEKEEQEYFLDWLAAKAQDFRFRGNAILMVTDGTQGVGRTTLSKYVEDIFGAWNSASIQFDQMINDSFNEWVTSLLVVVNEVKDSGSRDYRKMEALKNYVDTSPMKVAVNVKNGFKGSAETCASFLMFSNHTDALRIAREDRRFTVLRNTDIPDAEMTAEMVTWRLRSSYDAGDLYRYFRQRVIKSNLVKPLDTDIKAEMQDSSAGITEQILAAYAAACASEGYIAVPSSEVKRGIGELFMRTGVTPPDNATSVYSRINKAFFSSVMKRTSVRVGGEVCKPRLVKAVVRGHPDEARLRKPTTISAKEMTEELSTRLTDDVQRYDMEAVLAVALDRLSDYH